MSTIKVFAGESWRDVFNLFEMHFFSISVTDWPTMSAKKIKVIDNNYNAGRHQIHVAALNKLLSPFPRLTAADFDDTITIISLREEVLDPRMPAAPNVGLSLRINVPATLVHQAGLAHLLAVRGARRPAGRRRS